MSGLPREYGSTPESDRAEWLGRTQKDIAVTSVALNVTTAVDGTSSRDRNFFYAAGDRGSEQEHRMNKLEGESEVCLVDESNSNIAMQVNIRSFYGGHCD